MADNAPQQQTTDVNASPAGTSFFEPQAPAAAFGGGIAAGISDIGQDAGAIALKLQGLQNETNATNLSTKYISDLSDLKGQYYAKQGQAAVDAAPQYKSDLMALQQKYIAMGANPEETQMIAKDTAWQTNRGLIELGAHVPQQQLEASKQASASRIDIAGTAAVANRNDENQVAQYASVAASEVRKIGEIDGWDKDTITAKQQLAVGALYKEVVGGLLTDGKPQAASDMFDKVKNLIAGPDQVSIAAAIQPKLIANTIQTGADGIFKGATGGMMPAAGANIVPAADRPKLLADAVAGTNVPSDLVNAVVTHESGWNTNANSGVALGLGQVKPSTAAQPGFGVPSLDPAALTDAPSNLKFTANYLDGLGRKNGVTDWNDPAQVGKVLQDYNGSSTKEQYAKDVLAIRGAGGSAAPGSGTSMPQFPDLPTMLDKGRQLVESTPALANDPAAQDKMDAEITRRYHQAEADTASQRSAFSKTFRDAAVAAANGDIAAPDLEPQIRSLYPKAQADEMVQQYNDTKQAGLVAQQVKLAPAADLPALKASLDPNNGPIEDYAIREKKYNAAVEAITKRESALQSDPAQYAFQIPSVKAAFDAWQTNPSDPDLTQAYINETKAQQMRLGVPASQVSVLSQNQAQALVQKVETLDPATGNVTQLMQGMQKQYGDSWNDVLGSMQKAGLRPEYGIMATMDQPAQIGAQVDAQRMTSYLAADPKNAKQMETTAGPSVMKEIDAALDPRNAASVTMAQFNASSQYSSGGQQAAGDMRSFVRNLATYYATKDPTLSGSDAVERAAQGVIGDKYNFMDGARIPKEYGDASVFSSAASTFMQNMKPDDIAQNYLPRQFLEATDKDSLYRAAQDGQWVTNAKGDGVVRMAKLSNGAFIPLKRPDGQFIGFSFKDMQAMGAAQAAQPNTANPDNPPVVSASVAGVE